MLLQEPAESQYDLRFALFGFPIRIAWTFWLGAVVIGYGLVDDIDRDLGMASPGRFPLLALWGGCVLVSILIHELGHAFAFRVYGLESSVILYHFGGMAVPRGSFAGRRGVSTSSLGSGQDLMIAAAGPVAQIVSAMLLVGVVKAFGYQVAAIARLPGGFDRIPGILEGDPIESGALFALLVFYIFPSVFWALLNLIPVWPLDGGRVLRSIVLIFGGRTEVSLWISLIVAGLMAFYGFQAGQLILGILFLSLAISNYQMLQMHGGWRY